ncbi:NAD(P)/FAD-dependent oxidoreductase [Providencia sp. PROV188]|uniref:NAD(P)/FAD-dependent oxidoreductase n=1 Tax=Providencia TaxID=586 RepID=UPI0003E1DBCD|nr:MULTISPECIES: NAD(P)/FAD-dependent oxidoreductase [Providencia]MTB46840.1 aminoacetone oxidase family FAD-binding enzyme [Providencia sp. wls1950]MTC22840.1 aminoacetone oxidase family FAD-binding enzyme [Providencia sp. wls1938]MTC41601.1 aminoacetone oxidase family FAD-binding enzyme [Providencia sp. wls1921]MTC47199.1 aminoacetone oxidase family FAD-binding enzyme [Providencia sp. wls1922]MTC78180.1 aminoacetone oxidase family FAD-binding enzyme [Providencia sp. wls1916]
MRNIDVIILGAGAAGLFCASLAGKRGLNTLVLDNGKKLGRKILMSGGGRCNFTNMYADHNNYLSTNPHFCKSALARYTQWDFIELVGKYQIPYHEKTLGQLFCDNSAQDIVDMLKSECDQPNVTIKLRSEVTQVDKTDDGYVVTVNGDQVSTRLLVVATGGLSMPGLGATPFGYRLAEQFGHSIIPTRAALVPFTLHKPLLEALQALSGVSVAATVTSASGVLFKENILFTHRGLSGPAILQISNYWQPGEYVSINLLPEISLGEFLTNEKQQRPNQSLKNTLATLLPKRLIEVLQQLGQIPDCPLKQLTHAQIDALDDLLHNWQVQPNGTEGYRTAEVTLGGVDTHEISSKTMESLKSPGLYFIGEVMDVTGWLGGYNFQWAWSSASACAENLLHQA